MKSLMSFVLLFTATMVFAGGPQLKIGEKAAHTDVKMMSVSGEEYSLADLKGENGLVVIFSCNTCPFVLGWENRYNELKGWGKEHGVGMAVLNSNYQNRNGSDSLEEMKKHAKEKGYQFPYLVDDESLIANSFGGQTTPHVFLFDKDFKLVYKGAIDDNYENQSAVKNHYLKDAIQSVAKGGLIATAETKPMGCSIKRKLN
jgi:peroxiredoxin